MSLKLADLVDLPESPDDRCHLADRFLGDWLPQLGGPDAPPGDWRTNDVPFALAWAYARFGSSGRRLFVQDPLIAYDLVTDVIGDVVPFRREQQGCVEWGYRADGSSDPEVLMREVTDSSAPWEPHQTTLSMHLLEGVLAETTLAGAFAANLEASEPALEALGRLPVLGIPRHPFWAGAGTVGWHGIEGAVVRNDADTWLWAAARSARDLAALMSAVPGEWVLADQ